MKLIGLLVVFLSGVMVWFAFQPIPEELADGRAALAVRQADPVLYGLQWQEQANADAYAWTVAKP